MAIKITWPDKGYPISKICPKVGSPPGRTARQMTQWRPTNSDLSRDAPGTHCYSCYQLFNHWMSQGCGDLWWFDVTWLKVARASFGDTNARKNHCKRELECTNNTPLTFRTTREAHSLEKKCNSQLLNFPHIYPTSQFLSCPPTPPPKQS